MGLVDDRVLPGRVRAVCGCERGQRSDNHGLRHRAGIVAAVEGEVAAAAAVAKCEVRVIPHESPDQLPCIRVEQEFVGIETVALARFIRSVYAVTVRLAGRDVIETTVPDVCGALRKGDTRDLALARGIEQTEFDLFGMRRKQREVRARAIEARAERMRCAGAETRIARPPAPGIRRRAGELRGGVRRRQKLSLHHCCRRCCRRSAPNWC